MGSIGRRRVKKTREWRRKRTRHECFFSTQPEGSHRRRNRCAPLQAAATVVVLGPNRLRVVAPVIAKRTGEGGGVSALLVGGFPKAKERQ